jgi:hypothetical protein
MKEADIMLTVIIVYLIIGGVITLYLCNTLGDVVEDDTLAMKVIYYAWMIVIAPPLFIYGIAKGVYQELKHKSES